MTRASFIACALALGVAACAAPRTPEPIFLTSPATTQLKRPFSEAVQLGNVLYLSGFTGRIPGTNNIVPGGVQAETKQAMDNIKTVLERNRSSFDSVFKCTVMLADIADWAAMNEVYATYFKQERAPARSAFGVSGLAFGARVEVECMAVVK
jgi:reactive intermediate/imine deaminase